MNFSAVILAGGKSSRMGQDKARLKVEGRPLLARQIELVRRVAAAEIFISSRAGEEYSEFGLPVLHDRFPDAGPLGGIERALDTARSPLLLVLAVDMPCMTADQLDRLKTVSSAGRGVVPRLAGRLEPLAAFYPKTAQAIAAKLLSERSYAVRVFAEQCRQSSLVEFYEPGEADAHCFSNWNTPDDVTVPI